MKCPRCGSENRDAVRYCEECGIGLAESCTRCGVEMPIGKRFCGSCGAPAGDATDRHRSPEGYTPRHLAERILTARNDLEGERKHVTVLFADLKASRGGDLAPEPLPEQFLATVVDQMIDTVHKHEGTVNRVMGSSIMALFGAPLSHEDHAIRACHAALRAQEVVRSCVEEARRSHGLDLCLQIGLNSGDVLIRAIGNDLDMDYAAIDQTVSFAARMEQLAPAGSIRMTANTLRLAEGYVKVKPRGAVPTPGAHQDVHIYELVGLEPVRTRFQISAARGLTRFIGRDHEKEMLGETLREARAGQPRLVAAVGEAGVGKSRLIYEFVRSAQAQGWRLLEGGAASFEKTASYSCVIKLLKGYCGIEARDDVLTTRTKIAERILALDSTLEETITPVLALVEALPEDSPFLELDPPQRRQRILEAITRVLRRESLTEPLLLVLEDLHWSDSETLAVVDALVESLETTPLLILVSYRPEFLHRWSGKTIYRELRVDPLPLEGAEKLLEALLGDDPGLRPLKRILIDRTEGNPFFLEECSRTLAETGVLAGVPGAYRLGETREAIQVPETVQAVLAARIDRLPADEKRLLQLASVVGTDVPFALLEALTKQPKEELRRRLARLQQANFVYETRLFPDFDEYTFTHALTQEVAYDSLLEERRSTYHGDVGVTLEALYAGRTDEIVETLARHFGRSRDDERAVDYAILAAGKTQRRWANTEAVGYFEAALRRLDKMPNTLPNQLLRIDAVLKQAEVKFALGEHAEHVQRLEGIRDLIENAADPLRRAAWHYWTGFLQGVTGGRLEAAIALCRKAVEIAEAQGSSETAAFAESCLAQLYVLAGDLKGALAVGERALSTLEGSGNVWWACRTLFHLSPAANGLGEWERSLRYCRRALEHGVALNDLRLKVSALVRCASAHIQRGDPLTGIKYCEDALALCPLPFDAAAIKAIRGYGLVKAGKAEEGTADLEEARGWYERSGLGYTRVQAALWVAEGYLQLGKLSEAQALLASALRVCRESRYRHLEGIGLRLFGEALGLSDPTALAHLESATAILEEVDARNDVAKSLSARAALKKAAGDGLAARRLFEQALSMFKALGTLDEPVRVRAALAHLLDDSGVGGVGSAAGRIPA